MCDRGQATLAGANRAGRLRPAQIRLPVHRTGPQRPSNPQGRPARLETVVRLLLATVFAAAAVPKLHDARSSVHMFTQFGAKLPDMPSSLAVLRRGRRYSGRSPGTDRRPRTP
jgi:hypothetical protein